jgi:galactokinase
MIASSAPGRVNLIGEHTDYNEGFVLPTPIPQRTRVELRERADDRVVVWSRELGATADYRLGEERRRGEWLDYVMGCTAVLREAGHRIAGCELRIVSDVPVGSGLASSAALEIAVLRALREAHALAIDDVRLALLGQRAEVELVGAPVGAMDQLAASLGSAGAALFIDLRDLRDLRDVRDLAIRSLPLPAADLLVIASGVPHDHAAGDYRVRRAECEEAARRLGVRALRDVDTSELAAVARLPAPLDRRARHVVTENARVLAATHAIEDGDLPRLGALLREAHASMRDDFEASLPVIDRLVELAGGDPAIYGARITGGGFGGSIVALAVLGEGAAAAARIAERYAAQTHLVPQILIAGDPRCSPS